MYNKAFLIGNLTRDAELRYTTSGIPVCRFTIAINRVGKKTGSSGNNNQEVDFINIVAWRRLAEICGEYLKKGMPVAVEGRLQIRSFEGRDGQRKTMTEIVADNMQMLGRVRNAGPMSLAEGPSVGREREPALETGEEEIPF